MKPLVILCCMFMMNSCFPVRVAPKIETDIVVKGRKFKRSLSRDYALIFEDPKVANEFYNYMNIKYDLNDQYVDNNVKIIIDNQEFFISFSEVEILTKKVNLFLWMLDVKLEEEEVDPVFEDVYVTRTGHWYLVLTVVDEEMNDALKPTHEQYNNVVKYLQDLRKEYLSTSHYIEVLFKK